MAIARTLSTRPKCEDCGQREAIVCNAAGHRYCAVCAYDNDRLTERPSVMDLVRDEAKYVVTTAQPTIDQIASVIQVNRKVNARVAHQQQSSVTPPAPVVIPPTDSQKNYARTLLTEREGIEAAEEIRNRLNVARMQGMLTKDMMSAAITDLIAIRPPRRERQDFFQPQVGDGFYIHDGIVYKVQTSGTGNLYVSKLIPPPDKGEKGEWHYEGQRPLRFLTPDDTLTLDKAKEYGHLYGMCGVCGATLRKEESIERGIGPVCMGRLPR